MRSYKSQAATATGRVIALSLSYDSFPPSPIEGNFSDNNPHSYKRYLSRSKLITVMIPYIEIETVSICSLFKYMYFMYTIHLL